MAVVPVIQMTKICFLDATTTAIINKYVLFSAVGSNSSVISTVKVNNLNITLIFFSVVIIMIVRRINILEVVIDRYIKVKQ